ncbi:MAG: tetratricopeptide repeat protein [Candidatus Omnitrophica bacterium]|nr:tetratricopeptide repeat protein [Candidatus Omnitrophota bacterium]
MTDGVRDDAVRRRYGAALDLLTAKQPDACVVEIEKIHAEHPEFLDAYEGLAVVYSKLGRLDEAIEVMNRLVGKDPDSLMAHVNLSVFYMKKGMKDEAEVEKAKATVLQFSRGSKKL